MPTYSVHTAKSQDYQGSVPSQRQYGYVIRITPPIVTIQHGEDIEGIGWWPYHPPRRHAQHFVGWYRYKADALQRLEERTKAEVVHEHERNTHHQGISTRLAPCDSRSGGCSPPIPTMPSKTPAIPKTWKRLPAPEPTQKERRQHKEASSRIDSTDRPGLPRDPTTLNQPHGPPQSVDTSHPSLTSVDTCFSPRAL